MKYLIWIFALVFLIGCRSKNLRVSKEEIHQKEVSHSAKDSILVEKKQGSGAFFSFDQQQVEQWEIVSDKDSLGASKDLIFETEALPNGQKYTIRGGSLRLKAERKTEQKASFKDSLNENETLFKTQSKEDKTVEKKSFNKEKEVKVRGFQFGFYLLLAVVMVVVLLVAAYRLKLISVK